MTNPTDSATENSTLPETDLDGYSYTRLEENRRVIAAYRYRDAGDHWNAIAAFVRTSATLLADEPESILKKVLSVLSQFAIWAYKRGLPLEHADEILTSPNLFRFSVEVMGYYKPSSYESRLRILKSIIRKIGDPDPVYPRKPESKNYLEDRLIYTVSDQIDFLSSCRNRRTAWRESNFKAYIGLGFGAGLTPKELNDVRADAIVEEDGRWVVHVPGESERVVPIRREWCPVLLDGIATRKPGEYAILGYRYPKKPDMLGVLIKLAAKHQPHPKASVMRATWITEHLARGLRPDVVSELAGLKQRRTIITYLDRMPAYNRDDYLDLIVGDA